MRAIGFREYGGPEVLQEVDVPPEPIGDGRVSVRVTAGAVNPADIIGRSGLFGTTSHSEGGLEVPGLDLAGSYPANHVAEAHRRPEAGGVRGHLVLVFD